MNSSSRLKAILQTLAICLSASVFACVIKIIYGKATGSLAFIADGIHSLFDSAATAAGMVSVIFASKPPDAEHPYGHYKFETVSAIALGVLLFLAAYEVGTMAYERITINTQAPQFTVWGVVILVVTMAINLGVAALESRMAKKLSSTFLASDAVHNQSDFLITIAVFATIVSTHFQVPFVDAGVSLLITVYLIYLAIRLIMRNLQPLVDRSVLDPEKVEEIVSSIPGVIHCHQVRSRGEMDHYFLDLNIHLPGEISLEKAHEITHDVEAKLKEAFPGLVDVVIHTEPHDHPPCSH